MNDMKNIDPFRALGVKRRGSRLFPVVLGLLLSGCGNVTSGGFGDVEVLVSSDEVADIQETAASALYSQLGAPAKSSHTDSIVGTLTLRLRSFARRGVGDFVELTDGVQEVTLPLNDPQAVEVARRAVPTGRYDAVRTFFGRIEANIESGLVIDGEPVEGTVSVELAGEGFSTVTYTGFDVWENSPTVIAVDLQSRLWLRLTNAVLNRVDLEDFRRIFCVRVRQRILSGG
jgi:hypothetical protein